MGHTEGNRTVRNAVNDYMRILFIRLYALDFAETIFDSACLVVAYSLHKVCVATDGIMEVRDGL